MPTPYSGCEIKKKGHSSNTSVVSSAHVCVFRWTLQLSHIIRVSTHIRIKMEQVFVKSESGPMLTLLPQKKLYNVVEFITVTNNNNKFKKINFIQKTCVKFWARHYEAEAWVAEEYSIYKKNIKTTPTCLNQLFNHVCKFSSVHR